MENVKVVSAVSCATEQRAARRALHLCADSVNKSSSKFRDAGVALNAFALALGEKSPWFLTTAHNLSEPLRAEYDNFMAELQVGEASKPMYWLRVKEFAAQAAHESIEKNPDHPWAAHFQKMQEVKEKADAKLAAERARKEKAKQDTATLKAAAAKTGAVKPLAAELAKPATVADVSSTGPVDSTKAKAAFIRAKESLPVGERVVFDVQELLADIAEVIAGVPVEALPASMRKAMEHLLTAQRTLKPDFDKACAHLSRIMQGAQ